MAKHRLIVYLCIFGIASAELNSVNYLYKTNSQEVSRALQDEGHAQEALTGVYSECFSQISFSCLQRKVLQFLNRMSRMEKFDLFGKYLSVVRTRDDGEPEQEFQARLATAERDNSLDQLMEATIDRFFNSHVIRVHLPSSLAVVSGSNGRSADTVDLKFPETNEVEARKKGGGGGGGGGKMGKKMMMMMMMGLKAKLMMLGPMMMGLAGIMAMKALIAGVVSLTISKIMIIKKLMKQKQGGGGGGHGHGGWDSSSGGGGGGGWSSGGGGGGGGWDKRSEDYSSWDPSQLAYRAYNTLENIL